MTIACAAAITTAQTIVNPLSRIEILFAGDLMQHRSQLDAAKTEDGKHSFSGCYDYVRGTISSADLAVANLETTIGGSRYDGYPSFCAPDSFLYAAKDAGFDVMLLANNHCLDRGKRGAQRTLQMIDSLGLMHCGLYRDSADRAARYPLLIYNKGIKIALLNYTYGTNGIAVPHPMIVNFIDKETMAHDIKRAKEMRPDAIIACMHWGDEYTHLPPKNVKETANWLLEQGVDHIIGGHPHVVQPMEIREDTLTCKRNAVVYSLGNFISGMYAQGRDGGLLVRMGLTRIYDICWLRSLDYALTWVARPERDGVDNFTILPIEPALVKGSVGQQKMLRFADDCRKLFGKHNRGDIREFFVE